MEARASRLHQRLKQREKILIVLDNIWEKFNLMEVGIPSRDDHKGCKILLTSRDLHVLSDKMACQNNIEIHPLQEEEVWNLFKKRAGDCLQNPELLSIAQKISKKCGGLPLAISTVASALKNKSLAYWKDTLRQLERPSPDNFIEGVPSEVYCALQVSYNHLASKQLKSTFLLCCQGFISVGDLVKYGLGLSLFPEVSSIEEAKDRVQSLVDHLVAACLIKEQNDFIFTHDLVRDVGISIALKDENFFVKLGEFDLNDYQEDSRRSYKAMSLRRCTRLPEVIGCPQLHFLYLSSGHERLEIPDQIFEDTKNLRVLNITELSLPSLPSSLVQLQNLRTLYLHFCDLEDISMIGKLTNLVILSITSSKFECLPAEIGQLSKLKLLDLTGCFFLKIIPSNVLSKLSKLEDLRMQNSFDQWGTFEEQKNASLMELKHLSNLTNLEIHIRDPKMIPAGLFSERLKRFQIHIGSDWDTDSVTISSKILKLKLDTGIGDERFGVGILMRTVERLYLDQVKGVKNVLYQLNLEGFPLLKHLHIQNHPEIKHLVFVESSNWHRFNNVFPMLESLYLHNLILLEKFYSGELNSQSLGRLKTLEVSRCPKLKYLLTSSVAKGLSQLQHMAVSDCVNLEMIVAEESDANHSICFSQLYSLSLEGLPRLKCFHSKVDDPFAISPHQTSLFNAKVTLPNLEYLSLSSVPVKNIWHEQPEDFITGTQKLTTLVIQDCRNLCYLLSPSMVTSLLQQQQQQLDVGEGGETVLSLFPNLHSLRLIGLPKLTSFCIANLIELSSLDVLIIQACPVMREFISSDLDLDSDGANLTFFNRKVSLPKLEILHIINMEQLKMIWHTQLHPNSFCKLKILLVIGAKELLCIFPSNSFFTQFRHLEKLSIIDCYSMERVFDKQMVIYSQESNWRVASQLQNIYIVNLPNLKYIWNRDETDDLQGILSFHNLRKVDVGICGSLEALFLASVAKDLPQLEVIILGNCERLKEIVAKANEGVNKEVPLFKLHQLGYLHLDYLPNLSVFYPGKHSSEWPALKKLVLYHLPKLNIFDVDSSNITQTSTSTTADDRLKSVSQPFLPFAKILPNLDTLTISSSEVRMLPAGEFNQMKSLGLSFAYDESTVFSFDLLHKFPHLDSLEVIHGNFKVLFPPEEEDGGAYSIFQQLRRLILIRVDGVNRVWNSGSQLDNIQNIKLNLCSNLIEIVPSTASFQSLTSLEVEGCIRLQYIFSPTTAKSLVKLRYMWIKDCDMVTEIVKNEEDGFDDSIIFNHLARLELVGLPELSCFCSAKHTLKFPSLVELVVEQCPKMMIFSEGYLSTPELTRVILTEFEESSYRWDGNLNRTVKMLFQEKNSIQEETNALFSSL